MLDSQELIEFDRFVQYFRDTCRLSLLNACVVSGLFNSPRHKSIGFTDRLFIRDSLKFSLSCSYI